MAICVLPRHLNESQTNYPIFFLFIKFKNADLFYVDLSFCS